MAIFRWGSRGGAVVVAGRSRGVPVSKHSQIRIGYTRGGGGVSGSSSPAQWGLAFTRYSFTSRLLCTNRFIYHSPRPPALPTLVQYYCTTIGQYTTPLPTSRLYTIHHTRLVMSISCEGQSEFTRRTCKLHQTLYYYNYHTILLQLSAKGGPGVI